VQQAYTDEHAFMNQYYIQMKECIKYNLDTAYTRELFGKEDAQEYYNNVNEIHYLYFLLNYVLDVYYQWMINYDGTLTQEIKDAKIAELKSEYNFSCIIRHFRCFGCDIGFIMDIFCSTPAPIGDSIQYFCTSDTVSNLTAYGTDIQWYLSATSTTPLSSSTALINETHYYASQTVNGCESPQRFEVYVMINTMSVIPDSVSASSNSICSGENVVLSYTGGILGTNSQAVWYSGSCGGTLVGTGNNITVTLLSSTTFYVRFEDPAPCSHNTSCLSIKVDVSERPVPTFIVSPGATICAGDNVTYTTEPGQTDYLWNVPGVAGFHYTIISGGISSTDNTVTLQWNIPGIKVVSVNYENSNGCLGVSAATSTTTVNEYPIIGITLNPDEEICYNGGVVLTADISVYDSFAWTHNGHGTLAFDTTLAPVYVPDITDAGTTVTVVLTANYNGCISTEHSSIVIAPLAVAGTVSGGSTICEGETSAELTLSGYSGIIIRWEQSVFPYTTWTPIVNINDTYTSGALTQTTYFRAVVQEEPCAPLYSTWTIVTVTPMPEAPIGNADQYFCISESATVADLETITIGTILWYDQATPDQDHLLPPETALVDGTLYYASNTIDRCESEDTLAVTVHIDDVPTVTFDDYEDFCNGPLSVTLSISGRTNNPTTYSIVWDALALANGFINVTDAAMPAVGSDFNILIPGDPTLHGIFTGTLTPSNNCEGAGTKITIEIYETPIITLTDSDFTVYDSDADFDIVYSSPAGSPDEYKITWDANAIIAGFLDVAWTALGVSPIVVVLPIAPFTPIVQDVYYATIQVRNTTTGCVGPEISIIVTVIESPPM